MKKALATEALEVQTNRHDLPEGWATQRVQDVFKSFGGGTPNKATSAYWGGTIPWLSSGDIKTKRIKSASESITKAGLAHSSAHLCRSGSVVVVVRSGILKHTLPVAVLERDAAINQDIKCFDSDDDKLNAWLALALQSSAKAILTLNRDGTTVQSVKYETLKDFNLPIPPLAEQDRIIGKAEDLQERIGITLARLVRIPKLLKVLSKSVLAAAYSGRLTDDWRGKNGDDVTQLKTLHVEAGDWLEPNFNQRREKELPDGWHYVALGNLGEWGSGGTPSKSNPRFWTDGTIPWVSPKDMKLSELADSEDHITSAALSQTSLKLLPPDTILFVVRGMILAHTFPWL